VNDAVAGAVPVLMWEVRVADGRLDELLAWVSANAEASAEVYRSHGPQPRVVVIGARPLPSPPDGLVARPAHSWPFERIPR
jgi:hypothetical protein